MRRTALLTLLAAIAGCSSKDPNTTPQPAAPPTTTASRYVGNVTVDLEGATVTVPVPEDVFVGVTLAAAGWAKGSAVSRSVGVLQPDGAGDVFLRAIDAVVQKYAWRPMRPNDVGMSCQSGGGKSVAGATCSMKYVNAVLMLKALALRSDSGFVAMSVVKVPSGSRQMETTNYCVTLEYQGTGWVARRGEKVVTTRMCPRPAGMP